METLSFSPEWNAACLRVEDYLRANGISSRTQLLSLTLDIVSQAQQMHLGDASLSPVETAMRLATTRTENWFAKLVGDGSATDAPSRGRVAYFAARCGHRWPSAFLSSTPPEAMLTAIRSASIQAGPALEFRSLIRKEIDYGPMEDIARETWDQFSWSHVLRAFLIWVVVFFVAYGAWLRFFK